MSIAADVSILVLMENTNLTDQFLIAMPSLKDPNFEKTVTYICAHNEEGAMGIVINKPLDIELGEIFEQMEINTSNAIAKQKPVYQGGPVHIDRGFILHKSATSWDSSIIVSDKISVTTSKDILEAMAQGEGPEDALIALGYAGWDSGQLEEEILHNAWLNGPADQDIIFHTPYQDCWHVAVKHLGVDLEKLSSDVGHA